MNMAHLRNMDLNLLVVLDALLRHKNVTSASQELGMTQSGLSHALGRLRDHFKDPLLVRVSKGMEITEFARGLRPDVEKLITQTLQLMEKTERFDAKKAQGRIVIATTDYFEVLFGAQLLEILHREAPSVDLSIRPTYGGLPKTALEDGTYDIAIAGFYKDLPDGFYQQKILTDRLATAYRKNHPIHKMGLNIKSFYQQKHSLITLQGDFKDNLKAPGGGKEQQRKISHGSYSFTSPAWILAESDQILTAPRLLLLRYQKYFPIEVVDCPIQGKNIEMQMVWHSLTHHNPLRKWVRQLIKTVTNEPPVR